MGPIERRMAETLERVGAVNPDINAIVSLRAEDAVLAEAQAMDRGDPVGPLHGEPIAIKDLAQTAGIATTQGSPLFADVIPQADDTIVRRIRQAGAIVIGKTNTPEFGLGSHTFNPVFGATRNPYDVSKSAGGSSGGAGAALATSMLEIADGSDMMGSLRNPAGWNNVYSLRPSWGVVTDGAEGDMYLHMLSTTGPMARSPAGVARLLDVMIGADPVHPLARGGAGPFAPVLTATAAGRRIGWLGDWSGAYPMEPGILSICEAGLGVFDGLGATVTPVGAPMQADTVWRSWVALRSFAVGAKLQPYYADPVQKSALKPAAITEIERGLTLTSSDIQKASAARSEWFRAAMRLFETYDALVLPTAQMWPFPVEWTHPTQINGVDMDTYHRWMEVVVPVSLIGLPAVTLPVGFGANGLPMGIQVFGRPGSDQMLLNMAEAYHHATYWPQERSPLV
jgi:amidase